MYNWTNILSNIMIYSGLIGLSAGAILVYIGKNYDVYEKPSITCTGCMNKINNNIKDSDSDDNTDDNSNDNSDNDS